ncbi:ABC transporter substrate-binding protein, partial [Enterococcus faecalis]
MKKRVIIGTLDAATLLMTACGNCEATTKSESNGGSNALVDSTFGLSEVIVKKDIIAPFEKENE